MRRRWFVLLSLLAFGLALGLGGLLWQSVQTESVIEVQDRIDALKPIFTTIRWLLIGLVAATWPAILGLLHRWGRLDEAGRARWLSLRWRIVAWLILIELLLGQHLLGRFLTAWQGTSP
ncbi:MAG: hypothetical protein JAZ02_18805 [Candidatus Thiodiazotropha endolucinida]|nr:hypothetical protein [Candidatus Thiodiazotropha endolucinida]